ncbi:MAG: thiamine phosphate synthase [Candidatus Binataceae bacterium]
MRRAGFRFYLITDRTAMRGGTLALACADALSAAPPGTVALQVREKDLPARDLYRLALELREVCTRYGAPMIVNDRVDIALAARADGVHLPFDSIGVAMTRRLIGSGLLIGSSTHSPPDIASAARGGADFVVFGPIFDPISKTAQRPAWGLGGLAAACRAAAIPVYALGGITPERARDLMSNADPKARPAGAAGIGSILAAASPAEAMRAMLAALNSSSTAS